jgi:SAM-dependent methyltransferase
MSERERESRRTGILRLRHLMEATEARGEELAAAAPRFERLADPASRPRVVSAFNLFQTPEPLAARLAGLFAAFGRTLEPSAGLGRLYRAVRAVAPECPMTLVDNSPECCGELYRATEGDGNARLVAGDFLAMGPDRLGLFDAIIMNPPFKLGTDVKHVLHALTFLAPGGRLVSLVANGPRQREKLMPGATAWHDLPAGSFKESGTDVNAAIAIFEGPADPSA